MSWASQRQFQYMGGVFLFFAIIAGFIVYPILTKQATCTDGKQNGDERGVDCGGSCSKVCNADVAEPLVLWYRAFPVTGHNYNLVAYVSNTNKAAGLYNVGYEFRAYDTNNLLIGRREGTTYLPPNQQFAIFEPRFDSGKAEVKSVTFEFKQPFTWYKRAATVTTLPVHITNVILGDSKDAPTLSARINNESVHDLPEFDVVAFVYDVNHNVINASKTRLGGLESNGTANLSFSWPNAFSDTPVSNEVFMQLNPFLVSF